MCLEIKRIGDDCLSDMLYIENESFSSPWSEKSFKDALTSPVVCFYGAFLDGELCGFSCVTRIDTEAEILNIAVRTNHRRVGIGAVLLSETLANLTSEGASVFYLEVRESNNSAISLYAKAGFEKIGTRRRYYTNPIENAILMQKRTN